MRLLRFRSPKRIAELFQEYVTKLGFFELVCHQAQISCFVTIFGPSRREHGATSGGAPHNEETVLNATARGRESRE